MHPEAIRTPVQSGPAQNGPAQAASTEPGPAQAGDVTLHEIDDLLEQVARLVRSESTPEEFHLEVLERAVRALAAVAGAVWIRSAAGILQIESRVDLTRSRLVETLAEQPAHRELMKSVMQSGHGRLVLPNSAATAAMSPNPTEFLLLICPLAIGEEGTIIGALEVAQRPGGSPASHQGFLRLLEALCELAADYHHQRRLRIFQALAAKSRQIEQFALDVHASLDLTAMASAIACEGRRLIECDRLSVAIRRGRSLQLVAVSGLETLDRRANIVRRLEELANAVVAAGEPFWYAGDTEQIPPQIAGPLHAWQDESHARSLAIVPLPHAAPDASRNASQDNRRPAIAALIVERFGGERPDEVYRQRVATVGRQAELSLSNALEHESFPFFRLLKILKGARWFVAARRLPKTALVAIAVLASVVLLACVPADFEIEGRGLLQPRDRRNVFARSDGIISEIRIEDPPDCREGDVLAVMTRSQLDFESTRVLGEMQTARKRLASAQASRLKMTPQTAADREKYNLLTAEEEEVRESLKSLDQQLEILKIQRDELVVRSPLTGSVITWNVRQLLEARPVQRGQALMQVADLHGPWVLEVEVPDDRIGHVLAAQDRLRSDLIVTFMLATDPGAAYQGKIEKVAMSTDVRPPEKANVLVTVAVDRDQIPRLRPGATAVSRIQCGRRSIGFVWFHSLWETVQKKVLF